MANNSNPGELSPTKKIALVLASMGAENASQIYKHLSDDEVEAISVELARMEYHPLETVEEVLNEFYELLGIATLPGGDEVGWWVDDDSETYWIDFNNTRVELEDGLECWIIEPCSDPMVPPPDYGYFDRYCFESVSG